MVKHIYALDGLRAYSALMVLAFHTGILHFWYGWIGVQFFFVLSGFLISKILMDSREALNYFSAFYARRFLRIFPIYYVSLFAITLYAFIRHLPFKDFGLYFLYVQNFKQAFHNWNISFPIMFNHTWSLAIEEQFYIFFPLLVRYLKDRYLVFACVLLIVVSILTRYFLSVSYPGNPIIWANTFSNMDFLSAGVLIAISMKYLDLNKIKQFLKYAALVSIVTYSLFLYAKWHITIFLVPFSLTDWHGQLFLLLLLPVIGFVIISLIAVKRDGFTGKTIQYLFENRWIVYIGKISYGLYLFHYPVFYLIDEHLKRDGIMANGGGSGATYLVAISKFLITFLVAILSWHFFERKILKYKSMFSYKFIAK